MDLQRSNDSAIVQFVLAFENASVAAAKSDISVEKGCDADDVLDGISFGLLVEVFGAGASSSCFMEGCGSIGSFEFPDGIWFGSWVEVFSAGGPSFDVVSLPWLLSEALR